MRGPLSNSIATLTLDNNKLTDKGLKALATAADRGALIANPHVDTARLLPNGHNLYMSRAFGPAGWHEAITAFLTAEFG